MRRRGGGHEQTNQGGSDKVRHQVSHHLLPFDLLHFEDRQVQFIESLEHAGQLGLVADRPESQRWRFLGIPPLPGEKSRAGEALATRTTSAPPSASTVAGSECHISSQMSIPTRP